MSNSDPSFSVYSESSIDNEMNPNLSSYSVDSFSVHEDDIVEEEEEKEEIETFKFDNEIFFSEIEEDIFNILLIGSPNCGKKTFAYSLLDQDFKLILDKACSSMCIKQYFPIEKHDKLIRFLTINFKMDEPISQQILRIKKENLHRAKISPQQKIHLCFYLIQPFQGLTRHDIQFLRHFQDVWNIVPIISKSDCMTKRELLDFKKKIHSTLESEKISLFDFDIDFDEKSNDPFEEAHPPFAIVGSTERNEDGKRVRSYDWGSVLIDDEKHSDLRYLRRCLFQSSLRIMSEAQTKYEKTLGINQDKLVQDYWLENDLEESENEEKDIDEEEEEEEDDEEIEHDEDKNDYRFVLIPFMIVLLAVLFSFIPVRGKEQQQCVQLQNELIELEKAFFHKNYPKLIPAIFEGQKEKIISSNFPQSQQDKIVELIKDVTKKNKFELVKSDYNYNYRSNPLQPKIQTSLDQQFGKRWECSINREYRHIRARGLHLHFEYGGLIFLVQERR